MQTGPASRFVVIALAFVIAGAAGLLAPPVHAQTRLAGKYVCERIEMGGHTAPCQSPALVLHSDGTYEIWGEHGTYSVVQGRWLVLSHSKRRGLGHFENAREIVFEYRSDDEVCRVTFRRIFQAAPGFKWS